MTTPLTLVTMRLPSTVMVMVYHSSSFAGAFGIIASIDAENSIGPRLQFNWRPPLVQDR